MLIKNKIILCLLLTFVFFSLRGEEQVELIGDHQNGRVKHFLSEEIGIRLLDDFGSPISGTKVKFTAGSEALSVKDTVSFTDSEGYAGTLVKLGKEMGDYSVKAEIILAEKKIVKKLVFTAFDYKKIIFYIIGGLGMFLFGIKKVSDSLKILAGNGLKRFLEIVIKNRVLGVGVGLTITALLQSSSATTVMTLGFINAGLISLKQAIAIIMGANIGTTITAQIIAFKIGALALPAIAVGAGLILFGKSMNTRQWGNIIIGFGLLFYGLSLMTGVVKPLRSSVFLSDMFITLSHNHILAVLAGTIMTVLVQSSSATVGVTIALAAGGLIDLPAALGLVLGDNIGTTITAMLASLGSNTNAKRTAMAHVLFNLFGAFYMIILLYYFDDTITRLMEKLSKDIARQIANFHSIFNIFNTILFLPFINYLEKIVVRVFKEKEDNSGTVAKYLNKGLLNEPSLAIDQVKLELGSMLKVSKEALDESCLSAINGSSKHIRKAYELEDLSDRYQSEITEYIIKLSQSDLSLSSAQRITVLLHIVNDFEKIGDFAQDIAKLTEKQSNRSLELNPEQKEMIEKMSGMLSSIGQDVLIAFENNDQQIAKSIISREMDVKEYFKSCRAKLIKSISNGAPASNAIVTDDILANLEKSASQYVNVAQAVVGILSDDDKALYSDVLFESFQFSS